MHCNKFYGDELFSVSRIYFADIPTEIYSIQRAVANVKIRIESLE
jgi:hypothetical protein